jgi:hypothetical protein
MRLQGENPGTDGGLTDLFTHLSHVEHCPALVSLLMSNTPEAIARLEDLLVTYQMPESVKQLIRDYQQYPGAAKVSYQLPANDPAVQILLQPIKDACAGEIDRMWNELGIC